ncbi:MAG TPA: HEAT repeat domain-containing protein [Blastocatellia bacterium]|nr:HEAT repeat domain-containing protein [Blastocatellia bacterium]
MNPLPDVLSLSSQSSHWFGLLFDLAIKGAVILAVAALTSVALRRASAAVRHLVWNLALVSLLALPALSLVLPAWNVAVLPRLLASPEAEANGATAIVSDEVVQAAVQAAERRALVAAQTGASIDGGSVSSASLPDSAISSPASKLHWSTWLLVLWLGGAFLVGARLVAGLSSVYWITRNSRRVEDPAWTTLAKDLSLQLGLTREVALLESKRVSMPLTWGLFRSVILLPSATHDWTEERRHVVLSHELAHVKRKDCLTQTLAQAACALYWFNPLVWIAARQLRMERERACDDYVLHTGTRASDYASHLLDIARSLRSSSCSSLAAVAIARRSQLEGRLLAILDPGLSRRGLNRAGASLVFVAMVCVVLPLAAMRPLANDNRLNNDQPAAESVLRETRSDSTVPRAEAGINGAREADATAGPSEEQDKGETSSAAPDQASDPAEPVDNNAAVDAPEAAPDVYAAQASEDRTVETLKGALKDSDWEVRKQAAWSLGLKGDNTAVEPLIEALKDEHHEVREQAAWALGLKGDSRAVQPLAAALKDSDSGVREQAAWALGLKGNREAVEPLIEALKDPDDQVREQAAWALGLKGDSRAVDALMDVLRDSDDGVREQAAWALGLKGDRRALPALKEALKDTSGQVRDQARWAIGMILVRGGASSSITDDKEFEFEFNNVSEKVANALNSEFEFNLKLNVNPNPSPGAKKREHR